LVAVRPRRTEAERKLAQDLAGDVGVGAACDYDLDLNPELRVVGDVEPGDRGASLVQRRAQRIRVSRCLSSGLKILPTPVSGMAATSLIALGIAARSVICSLANDSSSSSVARAPSCRRLRAWRVWTVVLRKNCVHRPAPKPLGSDRRAWHADY